MAVAFRNGCAVLNFGPDYHKIRDFLLRLENPTYPFGRWDWMITHSYLDESGLERIGLWEEAGTVVGLATYDCVLGEGFFGIVPGYEHLCHEMLSYSREAFRHDGAYRALIGDNQESLQQAAADLGLVPSEDKESDALFPIAARSLAYRLPDGFQVVSLGEDFDLLKYGRALWKGFDHEKNGEGEYHPSAEEGQRLERSMHRPHVNLDLKIAIRAPDGEFVSYCGFWQDARTQTALLEPLATVPEYRRRGLARAAVLEGIRRCAALGSTRVLVGSSQQFYYSVGFRPYRTSTWWRDPPTPSAR